MALPSKPLTLEGWVLAAVIIWLGTSFTIGMNFGVRSVTKHLDIDRVNLVMLVKECEAELPRHQRCIGTVTVKVADNEEASR